MDQRQGRGGAAGQGARGGGGLGDGGLLQEVKARLFKGLGAGERGHAVPPYERNGTLLDLLITGKKKKKRSKVRPSQNATLQ